MKKLMSNILMTACFFSLFSLDSVNAAVDANQTNLIQQHVAFHQNAASYTWTELGHPSSYVVVLTPRASGSQIIFNTTNNYISLHGIADGIYKVTVYGVFSNKNSFIITQDVIFVGESNSTTTKTPPIVLSEDN